MERRDVFRLALRSGAVATVSRLSEAPVAASNLEVAPKVEFQKGTLSGGKFTGWEALLAITGRAVRGTIYDPGSIGGNGFVGYRVRGTANGKVMDLDLYELEDLAFAKPVGGGKGREKGRKTTTNFEVDGGALQGKQSGRMTSKEVPLSQRIARDLAGTYSVKVTEPETETVRAEFRLSALPNGKFTIEDFSQNGQPALLSEVAGRFGITREGSVFTTMLLPPPGEVEYDFVPSEVNLLTLKEAPASHLDGALSGFLLICFLLDCFFEGQKVKTGTLTGVVTNASNGRPLQGAHVDASGISTVSGSDGAYLLTLGVGEYNLTIAKEGFSAATFENVKVTENQTIRQNAALTPARTVTATGRVLGYTSGGSTEPLAGAEVTLVSTEPFSPELKATTGKDGRYSKSLPEGEYFVKANKALYREASTQVNLSPDHTTVPDIVLPLLPTVRFFGRVLSRPAPNDVIAVFKAQVSLHDWESDELRYTQNTGVANERFDFPDVRAGHYRIRIRAGGYYHDYTGELVIEQTTNRDIYIEYIQRVFQDEDFVNTDWEVFKLSDDSAGRNSIIEVAQVPTGGTLDSPFRRHRVRQTAGSTVVAAHVRIGASYRPSDGAIHSVRFVFDLKSLVGATKGSVLYGLVVRQGDAFFATDQRFQPHPVDWNGQSQTNVSADALWDLATHSRHPDFSVNGLPLSFGYYVITSITTNESGLDNWRVFLDTDIPE